MNIFSHEELDRSLLLMLPSGLSRTVLGKDCLGFPGFELVGRWFESLDLGRLPELR